MIRRRGLRASGGDTSRLYPVPMGEAGNVRTVEGGAYQRLGVEKSLRLARVTPAGNCLARTDQPGRPFYSFLRAGEGDENPDPTGKAPPSLSPNTTVNLSSYRSGGACPRLTGEGEGRTSPSQG